MKLGIIKAEDLIFSGDIEDDRTNTYLELDDYDWMSYTLSTRFKTNTYGTLQVKFEYFGTISSRMTVTQILNNVFENLEYEYQTAIFVKHIKKFLSDHINSWNSTYAFNGEKNVIDFYNEVIEVGILK
jgi:hypothetical protein